MPISTINSAGLTSPLTGAAITSTGGGSVATNTAFGSSALASNTTGAGNVAIGYQAVATSTTGNYNAAVGQQAMQNGDGATGNAALGYQALRASTGTYNTGIGFATGQSITSGNYNTAIGSQALNSNTTASNNTAVGYQAGYSNTTSIESTYIGHVAGYSTTGASNTFIGQGAGYSVTSGAKNTILGKFTGNSGGLNITTASNYIVLSDGDGNPRGQFNNGTAFALQGAGNAANPYITSFDSSLYAYGRIASSSGVYLANNATSWASTSDERRKDIIEPITNATEKLLTLRTVIGKFKVDEDGTRRPFLIAQDVLAVFPEAVNHQEDEDGEFLGMSYTDMIPLLVAAIKELKADLDATKAELAALKGTL